MVPADEGEEEYRTSPAGTGYTGYYDSTPRQNKSFAQEFTPVNTALVILNVLVFIIMSVAGSTEEIDFMMEHGAMYVPYVLEKGEYYRFFTCMFIHFGFMHLSGNMVVLLFLGDNVERAVGGFRYILIYVFGGLIGSIGSFAYALVYNPGIVSAGASGAIFGMIGALLWLVIRNKGRLEDMTLLRMCVLIAYALYNGITSENVDMAAHLFGLLGGFLVAVVLYRKKDRSITG
ncbi:MAG: rhomboid family intramembrane serine protease [Lachnospiraceae bacterium]|nr:rhomboid family intramembrane serine protease [Lachnospiraceae bacterium]